MSLLISPPGVPIGSTAVSISTPRTRLPGKWRWQRPCCWRGRTAPEPPADDNAWSPWVYGYDFLNANRERYFTLFWLARMTTVLATLAGGAVLFFWARELFDDRAAGITAALYFLNPNILAHGHLATIDAACATTMLVTLFALHWACPGGGAWRMAVVGLAWGLALLIKFTAVLLLPVLAGLLLAHRWGRWRQLAQDSVVLVAMSWLIVNLGMGFQGSFARLHTYKLHSQFGLALQHSLPRWLPVPLPRSYVEGFDQQKLDTELGEDLGNYYLFGVWSPKGWWHYSLVALVVKNPLTLTALVLVSPWFWRRGPPRGLSLWEIALPIGVLLTSMILFNRLNIGVRYLLPVFPLLLLLSAAVWQGHERWQAWVAGFLLLIHASTAALIHPGYLSYFNLAVGGPGQGHLVLLDSNLDWGQDLYRVPEALAELGHSGPVEMLYFGHVPPQLYGIDYRLPPPTPVAGVLAISVQYLMGGTYVASGPDGAMYPIPPGHVAWLRQASPRKKLGSIWIFDTRPR